MRIILIGSLFFVSCSTLQKAKPVVNQIPLTKENIPQINGEYGMFAVDSSGSSLDESLLFKGYWQGDNDNRYKYTLTLKAIEKQQLQVGIYKSSGLINTKNIHYKIKKGALLIKRKKFRIWVIFNGYGTMHTRLRVNTAGELIIDHSSAEMGCFLILPFAGVNVNDEGIVFQKRR